MSCENLVCASCAGVVVEGRCASCRATRAHVHDTPRLPAGPLLWLAVAVAALLALSLLL